MIQILSRIAFVAFLALSTQAGAQSSTDELTLTIKDHRFSPTELTVPAGKKFRIVVDNQDATAEEFESKALRVEKVIPGKKKATINLGPLKPGSYAFVGEFHESTAKGTLVAK